MAFDGDSNSSVDLGDFELMTIGHKPSRNTATASQGEARVRTKKPRSNRREHTRSAESNPTPNGTMICTHKVSILNRNRRSDVIEPGHGLVGYRSVQHIEEVFPPDPRNPLGTRSNLATQPESSQQPKMAGCPVTVAPDCDSGAKQHRATKPDRCVFESGLPLTAHLDLLSWSRGGDNARLVDNRVTAVSEDRQRRQLHPSTRRLVDQLDRFAHQSHAFNTRTDQLIDVRLRRPTIDSLAGQMNNDIDPIQRGDPVAERRSIPLHMNPTRMAH